MNHRILALIWKELLTVLRDRKIRLAILLPPLVQLFIFTFAATLDVKNVPIGIINRDNGEQGFELVQRFYGSPLFTKIHFLQSMEEIPLFLDLQKGVMVLSIDASFSRNLDANKKADIQLILDGRKSNTAQIVAGYASQIIQQFNQGIALHHNAIGQNGRLIPRNWFNPNILYFWYNIPSLVAVLSMLTCLVVTTQSIARERELGTFDQLLVSPLLPYEIIIGKIIPGILVGLFEGILLLLIGVFLLGVPFTGSFLLYLFSLLIFVISISGVGLFISSLSKTQQQAMLGTFIFMSPSVMLSGFATPIENMPTWLQPLTYAMPLKYMLIISKGIFLKAMPANIVLERIGPMVIIAICTLTISGIFFRRRLE